MSERPKRDKANTRPGQIIIDNTQKRRTSAQVQEDAMAAAAAKAEKQAADARLKATKVGKIAAAEDKLRQEDEVTRKNAERPDLAVGKRATKKSVPSKTVRSNLSIVCLLTVLSARDKPPRMNHLKLQRR